MLVAYLLLAVVGAVLVVFGVNRIKAPVLWNNRAQVAEENKTVFGKLMGTAQLISGTGILLFSVMGSTDILTAKPALWDTGLHLMIVLLAVAFCIYVFTLIKYYKKTY